MRERSNLLWNKSNSPCMLIHLWYATYQYLVRLAMHVHLILVWLSVINTKPRCCSMSAAWPLWFMVAQGIITISWWLQLFCTNGPLLCNLTLPSRKHSNSSSSWVASFALVHKIVGLHQLTIYQDNPDNAHEILMYMYRHSFFKSQTISEMINI